MNKPLTYAVGLALAVTVASPALQNWRPPARRVDDFPLSYYPMFSAARTRTGTVRHLIGIDAEGREHILHFRHAGTGGLNQVRRQITRRVREGRAGTVAATVAGSVAASPGRLERTITTVQVVTSRHRYDDFFAGDRTPRSRIVLAEVTVDRPASPGAPHVPEAPEALDALDAPHALDIPDIPDTPDTPDTAVSLAEEGR